MAAGGRLKIKKAQKVFLSMTKNDKRRGVISEIAKERGVSFAVAAHIYNCWPRKKQQYERAKLNT